MLISRKQSILLAISILIAFFAFSLIFSATSSSPKNRISFDVAMPTIAPSLNPSLILNQFHREEVKDGKKVWEITAEQGALNPETNTATITNGLIKSYREDNTEVRLQAPFAEVHIDGATISKADLSGGIKLFYGDKYTVETDKATIVRSSDNSAGIISAENQVVITGNSVRIKGVNFEGDLQKSEFKFKQKVETVFYPKGSQ